MNILLDYFFPITSIEPTPQASTAFLKQVLAIVKPAGGGGGAADTPTLCVTKAAVDAFSNTNVEVDELFNAGMNRVYVMASTALTGVGANIAGKESDFHTILISSDFSDAEIDAMDLGQFKGVVGLASTDDAKNATRAAIPNRVAFHSTSTNKAKNMFFAMGSLLSNALKWSNQQYIPMPYADDVNTLGKANALFDDKISFVISDSQFGNRLALLAAGGKAIVAPYITKNMQIDIQSKALSYISGNQPAYSKVQAALLEDELQKVPDSYIARQLISDGKVEIKLEQENFVASAYINIAPPTAFWRAFGEMKQTLSL